MDKEINYHHKFYDVLNTIRLTAEEKDKIESAHRMSVDYGERIAFNRGMACMEEKLKLPAKIEEKEWKYMVLDAVKEALGIED